MPRTKVSPLHTNESIDHYWWKRLKEGEREALAYLYQTYSASMLRFGYRICFDRDLVRDSIQDVFVELWEHRHGRGMVQNSKFYLFRMLKSHLSKKLSLQYNVTIPDKLSDSLADETIYVECSIIARETDAQQKQQLAIALNQLTPRQREAVVLRFYDNFSYEEIAGMMTISYQAVVNLIYKATVSLRRTLPIELFTATGLGLYILHGLDQVFFISVMVLSFSFV